MTQSTWWSVCTLFGALAIGGAAQAAHPLQTEDTGTQGAGNVEWENGLSWTRAGGATTFVYQPQFSYGLTSPIDLIVQPSWTSLRDASGRHARGQGDTNLDAKLRFFGEAPLSLAVRAGLTLATSQRGIGLPHGDVSPHALLVATWDAAPFTFHGNVGLAQNPGGTGLRRRIGGVSGAVMFAVNERFVLTADAGLQSSPDPTQRSWPATLLAGAIYTVRPGLDVDLGYQASARTALPTREWLVGLTYRFAP